MQSLVKQPSEELKKGVTIPGAGPIATVVSVTAEPRGLVPDAEPLSAVGTLTAGMLFVQVAGGSDGERYLVTALVDDAAGDRREAELEIVVIEAAWTMPDGGAGYLSIAEFVDRFGLDEVVRMTDGGDGRIDRSLLVNALRSAQGIVDVHIGARYALPIAPVPEIVKIAVADMTRARLYPRGAPEGVDRQAKEAMGTIEKIGQGKLPLGVAVPVEQAVSETPILISPGRRQYADGLAGY